MICASHPGCHYATLSDTLGLMVVQEVVVLLAEVLVVVERSWWCWWLWWTESMVTPCPGTWCWWEDYNGTLV